MQEDAVMPTLTRDHPGEEARPLTGDAALAASMTEEEMERDIEAILDRVERGLEELKLQQAVTLALLDRPRG